MPHRIEIPPHTLPDLLTETARRFPRRAAAIFEDGRLSYAALDTQANRFANALIRDGFQPGERMALYLPNCPQFMVGLYGALRAGAVVVPLNPLYKGEELAKALQETGTGTILTLTKLYPNLADLPLKRVILSSIGEYLPPVKRHLFNILKTKKEGHGFPPPSPHLFNFQAFLRHGHPMPPKVPVKPEDLALLQYTGGTTGHPKAARLTHHNLVANVHQAAAFLPGLTVGGEIFAAPAPFFHVLGLTGALNLPIYLGATIILFPRFNARETLAGTSRHRASVFIGVPAMYVAMSHLRNLPQTDLSALRFFISGAAPLPTEVKRRFEEISGARIVEGYGLTEASPVTHLNPLYGRQKAGSIGLPLPNTEARIIRLDEPGREAAPGEEGELQVRGPQVMVGYWNDHEATSGILHNGWLSTGDIATTDEEGYFYIVDRKKDLVIVGGYNVYPREIEDFLYTHPQVKEVAVVGIPHPLRGEIVAAYVVAAGPLNPKDIIRYCREGLPTYKVPRQVELVDSIPKTLVGKPLRWVLRAQEAAKAKADAD